MTTNDGPSQRQAEYRPHPNDPGTNPAVRIPGPEFWGMTPFEFVPLDGWVPKHPVDQIVYLHAHDDPAVNFGIQWKRTSPNLDLRVAANVGFTAVKQLDPRAVSRTARFVRINGAVGYLRLTEFEKPIDPSDPLAGTVRTGQVFVVIPGPMFGPDRPVELFELVGHFPAAEGIERSAQIRQMIGSFRFNVVPASNDSAAVPDVGSLVDDISSITEVAEVATDAS